MAITLQLSEGRLVDASTGEEVTLEILGLGSTPVEIEGERDDPESALANLLTGLALIGLVVDSTTETTPP